jgi:hypothetical protein
MTLQESAPAFENTAQRAAFSYQRQLHESVPVLPESLSLDERDEMQVSQGQLDAFFRALYHYAYNQPAALGLPTADDLYIDEGATKERKRDVTKTIKKARDKLALGVEYLYHVGRLGTLVNDELCLQEGDYASFFAKSPRVKRKLVTGMQAVGLTVSEQEDKVLVSNAQYPRVMLALKTLAEACADRDDNKLGLFLFARCDFHAFDAAYRPNALDMLGTALSPTEFECATALHHGLLEVAYMPTLDIGGVHNWRIQYQGKRAIKSTPFFEFEYDERQKHQLIMRVKCASTNRLVPLLNQQPASLQQDFFHHAHNCGAPKCSWCKTRKSLGPSVLEQAGETKTICWWMQRRFTEMDSETVHLVEQYASLHEALAAA